MGASLYLCGPTMHVAKTMWSFPDIFFYLVCMVVKKKKKKARQFHCHIELKSELISLKSASACISCIEL